jgi:hypothetical protein
MRWLMTLIKIKGRSTKSRAPPISGIRLARRAEHRQPNKIKVKCPRYVLRTSCDLRQRWNGTLLAVEVKPSLSDSPPVTSRLRPTARPSVSWPVIGFDAKLLPNPPFDHPMGAQIGNERECICKLSLNGSVCLCCVSRNHGYWTFTVASPSSPLQRLGSNGDAACYHPP